MGWKESDLTDKQRDLLNHRSDATEAIRIDMHWPPSVNHYKDYSVRRKNGKHYVHVALSKDARIYQATASVELRDAPRIPREAQARVDIWAFPPDHRTRDLDNVPKVVLDTLEMLGILHDDSQVMDLRIRRGGVDPPGRLEVKIEKV